MPQAISGYWSVNPPVWDAHGEGQSVLIRLRGQDQFNTDRGRSLFRSVQDILQSKDMSVRANPTLGLTDWPESAYLTAQGDGMGRLLSRICVTISQISALLAKWTVNENWASDVAELAQKALALEQEARRFCESAPVAWRYWPVSTPLESSLSDEDAAFETYPKRILVYRNNRVPATRMTTFTGRVRLLQAVLDCAATLTDGGFECPTSLRDPCLRPRILEIADDMCGSIPALLNEVDSRGNILAESTGTAVAATKAIYPLHLVASLEGVPDGQANWAVDQLERIGRMWDIKQATMMANYHRSRLSNRPIHKWNNMYATQLHT